MTEVRVAAGVVRGELLASGVAVFRGIPFAEPPVGERRFAAPQPVRTWDGVREAVEYGPPPPQSGLFGMDALANDADDNWLTVNVFTPDLGARLPVMVWIHGGGYMFGTSGLPEYDGDRLVREGGVVLVTFNYRTGIEGFAQFEGAPANRGLLDQVAALEWVRDNIAAFGGDPGQVTVFGESAGGGSVAALLAMPRAAGLFHRAIVQSMPGVFLAPELATDIAGVFAAELGRRPTAADMATVVPAELPAVGDAVMAKTGQWTDRWGLTAHRSIPVAPVVDGDVLPTTPWAALAGDAARDIDLMAGHVRNEQRLFTFIEGIFGMVTDEQATTALDLYAPSADGVRQYRATGAGPDDLYDQVHSDWVFRMPSLHLAEAHTGRTHVYELTWPAPGSALGACHGLDVPLVFGNLTSGQPAMLLGDDLTEAEAVSAQMRKAWTAFATTGDPGWPEYDLDQRLTRIFDTEPAVVEYPEDTSRRIWSGHEFSVLPLITG